MGQQFPAQRIASVRIRVSQRDSCCSESKLLHVLSCIIIGTRVASAKSDSRPKDGRGTINDWPMGKPLPDLSEPFSRVFWFQFVSFNVCLHFVLSFEHPVTVVFSHVQY